MLIVEGGPRPRWDRLDIEDQFMFAVGHPSNWKVTVELLITK